MPSAVPLPGGKFRGNRGNGPDFDIAVEDFGPFRLQDDLPGVDGRRELAVYPDWTVQSHDDLPVDDVDAVVAKATSSTVFHSPVGFSLSGCLMHLPDEPWLCEKNVHSPAGS